MKIAMRLFKRKRDGIWYVEFKRGQARSLKTRDKKEAKALFAAIKKEYLAGRLREISGQSNRTLGEFIKEFCEWAAPPTQPKNTYRANKLALNKLADIAGENTRLDKLNIKHIDQLIAKCKRENLSVFSINNYLRHLRSSFNKAVDWKYLPANPFRKIKELPTPKSPPKFMEKKDIVKFLASIEDEDLQKIVIAYLATGRRRSELLNLTWQDVNLEKGIYYIRKAKRHLSRYYPIPEIFRAVLESLPRNNERVFPRWKHPDTISHKVKKALRDAGYGHLRLHDLRHTFGTLFVEDGGDLRTLQDMLGHTEYRTTEIYAHVSQRHLKEEANRVQFPVPVPIVKK